MSQWLERYAGGWQLVLPNGGDACEEYGVEWGFHGEACLVPWEVDACDAASATLSTDLFRAPLSIERTLEIDGPVLRIEETVTNTSPDLIELMWSHHPAFGAPFLEAGCALTTGARTYLADGVGPGTMLAPGLAPPLAARGGRWTEGPSTSADPSPTEPRAHFGYLSEFDAGWFALTNPRLELGVALRWPLEVFPHAWFWQEIHSSGGLSVVPACLCDRGRAVHDVPGPRARGSSRQGGTPFGSRVATSLRHGRGGRVPRSPGCRSTRLGGALEFAMTAPNDEKRRQAR